MKINIIKKIFVGFLLMGATSCDFLEVEPLDSYTESNVFSDISLVNAYVTTLYVTC